MQLSGEYSDITNILKVKYAATRTLLLYFMFIVLQFAMHYSWSTEARARRALANISALLRPGGTFIGTMPDANVIIKRLREGI